MRFQNRAVIVTGGSKGIGAGCAEVLSAEGGLVSILDLDEEAGNKLAAQLNDSTPGRVICTLCDVANPDQFQKGVAQTVEQFGRLDCMINNAGQHPPAQALEETSIEDAEKLMRINFLSTYLGAKYAVPHLRSTKGTIINISSMTAVLGQTNSALYAATKGAQLSFTKALALELGPEGIRVNAVLPSNVDTPLMREWASTLDDPQEALDRIAKLQVFSRMADPQEIGRVCLFLATEDSSFITGQGIQVDGGAALDY